MVHLDDSFDTRSIAALLGIVRSVQAERRARLGQGRRPRRRDTRIQHSPKDMRDGFCIKPGS